MIKIKNKTQKTWNDQRKSQYRDFSWGQKGIDTKIILDMCRFAYENNNDTATSEDFATAILVSGDEDFSEVIKLLKEKHIRTELVCFNRRDSRTSDELKSSVDSVIEDSYSDLTL